MMYDLENCSLGMAIGLQDFSRAVVERIMDTVCNGPQSLVERELSNLSYKAEV